jgi:hypothetical protein
MHMRVRCHAKVKWSKINRWWSWTCVCGRGGASYDRLVWAVDKAQDHVLEDRLVIGGIYVPTYGSGQYDYIRRRVRGVETCRIHQATLNTMRRVIVTREDKFSQVEPNRWAVRPFLQQHKLVAINLTLPLVRYK